MEKINLCVKQEKNSNESDYTEIKIYLSDVTTENANIQAIIQLFEYMANNDKFEVKTPESFSKTGSLFSIKVHQDYIKYAYDLLLTGYNYENWGKCIDLLFPPTYETFDKPTQVLFIDGDDETIYCGIAYKDEIICADCGGIYEMNEVIIIRKYDYWMDLSNEIKE